ncbi:MAG: transglycosylase SLT domain-containing protein [bacterium]
MIAFASSSCAPHPRIAVSFCRVALSVAAVLALSVSGPARADAPRIEVRAEGVRWSGARLSGVATDGAPVERWVAALADTGRVGEAVRIALADSTVARGDTLAAEGLLDHAPLARSLWAWDALRRRVAWRLAAGDTTTALRLLEGRDRSAWPANEEAEWRARLATLRLARRDTVGAEALALEGVAAPAGGASATAGLEFVRLLDTLAVVRRAPLAPEVARRVARTEWAGGRRGGALVRLGALARGAAPTDRAADQLQRARWWREWRKPRTAAAAADTALRWAVDAPGRDAARLERARALRDAGETDASLALYAAVGNGAGEVRTRALAWWEAAREAQDESRWAEAERAFLRADSLGTGMRETREAGTLAGVMRWVRGDRAGAEALWRDRDDRRARFWYGVALRARGLAEGDSLLRVRFAERPGHDLLDVAARDTLGAAGWPGRALAPAPDTLEPALVDAVVRLAGPLALPEAAARLVSARDRADARLPRGPQRMFASASWRAVAVAAYAGGDLAGATRAADRALLAPIADSLAWDWLPWAFPPAFERELRAAASESGIEPALLWALVRQESRFDPRAVSRSGALGLAQLLPGTARDVARWSREGFVADSTLFEPALGLRYGARYLRRLLDRFDGHVAVALTAYNAGPGKVRADWRELVARGGDALYCEMAANADTQDYVRRILGYRQAYRVLRPHTGP